MSSSNDRPRALLPRSVAHEETPATSDSNSTPLSARTAIIPSTRTNIRSACLACRRRRSRCSGGSPCNRCRALDTECTYNEFQDGRTRALRERSKEELDLYKQIVHGMFQAVREGKEQHLMDLIRQNASLETIAAAIEELRLDSPSVNTSGSADDQSISMQGHSEDGITRTFRNYQSELFGPSQRATGSLAAHTISDESSLSSLPDHVLEDELLESSSNIRHMLQPLHREDDTEMFRMSRLYINFRDDAQEIISQGSSFSNIPDTSAVSCNLMFDPQATPFNLSAWASIVVNSITGIDISFKLAWLCYLTRFMREHFDHMPAAMRPTNLQLSIPHPPAIDLIPLPQIRDLMISDLRDFTAALRLAGATVLWTRPIENAIDRDPTTGDMTISPAFEMHISDINNFFFGRNILDIFPELEGQINIAEQDQIVILSTRAPPVI